jgi:hypothetical protein
VQHGLGRKAAVVAARTAEPGGCVAASARQTGVSSRDAYLFLDLADETAVVAGRFLRDPAAASRRQVLHADTSYIVMIPADVARETGTRSAESCSAQRRDAQP